MQEKFIVYTWGCQMNEDDAAQLSSFLLGSGYEETKNEEEADIAVLVTCSVREKPENKAKSKLGELRILKEKRPHMIIGVSGCMAQREGEKLRKGRPYLDFVVGTGNIAEVPGIIEKLKIKKKFYYELDLPTNTFDEMRIPKRISKDAVSIKEFVPIMYGCNNFCSYCVVPYVRGRERSRTAVDIIDEIKYLADNGTKEITLLGQNVNSYGNTNADQINFTELLYKVNEISGIERIRFTTSHPKDLSDDLILAMKDIDKVCKHIHLAVQSGDSDILKSMNRKYLSDRIYELTDKLRSNIPDIAISTDLIVGFPGETDEQFRKTLKMVEDIKFDWAYMFSFNPIPNTPAEKLAGQMTMKEKNTRLNELVQLQNAITVDKNKSFINDIFEVLVEGKSNKDQDKFCGLTSQSKTVNFSAKKEIKAGDIVNIRVRTGHLYGFLGEMIDE